MAGAREGGRQEPGWPVSDATPERCPRHCAIAPHVAAQRIGDETILLNLDSGVYYSLNAVASTIWRHLEHGLGRDEITRALTDEYQVGSTRAALDAEAFMRDALDCALLVPRPEPAP